MKKNFIILIFFTAIISCSFLKTSDLTEDQIKKYITAYSILREMGSGLVSENGEITAKEGKDALNIIEKTVKDAGFKSYLEFFKVNAAVGTAMSIIQSNDYISKMDENLKSFEKISDQEGEFKDFYDMLNDPNVPEEQKLELKKSLEQARLLVKSSKEEFNKQKKYAQPILDAADKITNKKNIELVAKYKNEILEAYTGIKN